jgi:hypothetical protein
MPMLHGCGFPGCSTLTLSTYCVEHELLARALKEAERQHEHEADEELVAGANVVTATDAHAQEAPQI